jgi:O-antigen/teichoic acid export membrane protein
MLLKLKKIISTDLVKVSFLNAIATLIKFMTGFVSVKVVATALGPAGPMGIALLGQLNNFASILWSIASGGITAGMTKYVAQYSNSEKKYNLFLGTAFWITVVLSVITGLVVIIWPGYFSLLILKDAQYKSVFYALGGTIILYALNTLLVAVMNGFREFKKYVIANIVASITGMIFATILSINFGIQGALIGAVTYQSVVFVITLAIVANTKWFQWKKFSRLFSKTAAGKLSHYSLMALVTAIVMPVSQIIVRNYITQHTLPGDAGLAEAGLWEGVNKISIMYLMVVMTSLSVYYLPKLTELHTTKELRNEIFSVYKLVLPFLVFCAITIYFSRHLLIAILYTEQFVGMEKFFIYQLFGDFFKMAGWVIAYIMIAKSMTKTYIVMELVSSSAQAGFGILFINMYGSIGGSIGYAAGHLLFLIIMIIIFRKIIFYKSQTQN